MNPSIRQLQKGQNSSPKGIISICCGILTLLYLATISYVYFSAHANSNATGDHSADFLIVLFIVFTGAFVLIIALVGFGCGISALGSSNAFDKKLGKIGVILNIPFLICALGALLYAAFLSLSGK
jgi:hypothetical protein